MWPRRLVGHPALNSMVIQAGTGTTRRI